MSDAGFQVHCRGHSQTRAHANLLTIPCATKALGREHSANQRHKAQMRFKSFYKAT